MTTRSSQVHISLREDILAGRLSPGARLVARDVAAAHGISEVPVREALWMLQRDGLVEMAPNRGAKVVSLTAAEVAEGYLIRAELEGLATRLAVPYVSERRMQELKSLVEQMSQVIDDEDASRYWRLNRQFHEAIFSASPHRRIRDVIAGVWDGQGATMAALRASPRRRTSHEEHVQIMAAIEAGDADRAGERAREHKLSVGRMLATVLSRENGEGSAEADRALMQTLQLMEVGRR